MEILGPITGGGAGAARQSAFTLGQDMSCVITEVVSVEVARSLPRGSVVGDTHGGLTFTDAVASVLERRSLGGWHEMEASPGTYWTIIVLNR
jgi:hypothetical protein